MIYFDNAATQGKRPPCVFKALHEGVLMSVNPMRTSGEAGKTALSMINEIRNRIMRYCGITEGSCALLSGCTEALNLAIGGLTGDGAIVTTQAEHNAVLRPIYEQQRKGREVRILEADEGGRVFPSLFENALEGASFAVVTHVSNVTGGCNDIKKLYESARARGVIFVLDAAQSAGHIAIEGMADIIALPAHKGLYGVSGCGALVIREGIVLEPIMYGGTGSDSQNLYMPDYPPERYEAGTRNIGGILAWGAALEWLEGKESALAKVRREVQSELVKGLTEIEKVRLVSVPNECGIVSFVIEEQEFDSALWCEELSGAFGIACRGGLHCAPLIHERIGTFKGGAIRLSVEASNTLNEAKYAVKCVKTLCERA